MSDTTLGFDADLVLIYHSQSENVSDAEPLANVEEDVQGHVHEGRCVVSATETYPILARKVNHPMRTGTDLSTPVTLSPPNHAVTSSDDDDGLLNANAFMRGSEA